MNERRTILTAGLLALALVLPHSSIASAYSPAPAPAPKSKTFTVEIRDLSSGELVNSLRTSRVETLYYDGNSLPPNVADLVARDDVIQDLMTAFDEFIDDPFARFNVILVLNRKLIENRIDTADAAEFLASVLDDPSPWVRTEAVWGLGNCHAEDRLESIIRLLDDTDTNVVNEAILALARIVGSEAELPNSNQFLTDEERTVLAEDWKRWWSEQSPITDADPGIDNETAHGEFSGEIAKADGSIQAGVTASFVTAGPSAGDRRLMPAPVDSVRDARRPIADAMDLVARLADQFVAEFGRAPASEFELSGYATAMDLPEPVFGWSEGTIRYAPSLAHRSFTVFAFDGRDKLVMSLHTGGVNFGYADYEEARSSIGNEPPIGWTPINLLWTPPWETNPLGHLVSDAMREASGADVALMNAYGLRENIPAGPIYESDFNRVLPWGNGITVIEMSGRDLVEIVRRGVDDRWFLYPAGILVRHNHQLGIPQIVVSRADGVLIDPDSMVSVAVPDYLANGGDGFTWLAAFPTRKPSGMTVNSAVAEYLRNHVDWRPDSAPRVFVE